MAWVAGLDGTAKEVITDGKERQESAFWPLELDKTQEPRSELAKQAWRGGGEKRCGWSWVTDHQSPHMPS